MTALVFPAVDPTRPPSCRHARTADHHGMVEPNVLSGINDGDPAGSKVCRGGTSRCRSEEILDAMAEQLLGHTAGCGPG